MALKKEASLNGWGHALPPLSPLLAGIYIWLVKGQPSDWTRGGIRVTRETPWSPSCSENAYMQTSFAWQLSERGKFVSYKWNWYLEFSHSQCNLSQDVPRTVLALQRVKVQPLLGELNSCKPGRASPPQKRRTLPQLRDHACYIG